MEEKTAKQDRFNWRLTFYAAIGAFIPFIPVIIIGGNSGALIILVIPIICIILLVVALIHAIRKRWHRSLAAISMLVVYCVASLSVLINTHELHSTTEWFLRSNEYKAKLQSQTNSLNGELRHTIWDWGGIPCCDQVEYLVFDPDDSLLTASKDRSSGKFPGIPCEVPHVRRLESHYYTVLLYENTDWSYCGKKQSVGSATKANSRAKDQ